MENNFHIDAKFFKLPGLNESGEEGNGNLKSSVGEEGNGNLKNSVGTNPIDTKPWILKVFRFLDINNLRSYGVKFQPYSLPKIITFDQSQLVDIETKASTLDPDYKNNNIQQKSCI